MDHIIKNKVVENDKKLVISGVFWTFLQLIVNQSFAFILKLILAKLLYPNQFGLVGMAAVFTGFVQVLNDLGIGAALVQRKKDQLRNEHYHTAFWTGVIWSVLLFAIMSLAVAPLAAHFYNEPLLKAIIPVLSIGILMSPVNLVHKAQLSKQMSFKKLAFIDNASNIAAGIIAFAMAWYGAGVWALVFNSVATVFFAMPLFFNATGWKPAFVFEKQAFKEVFGFGAYATGSNIMNYLYNNLDYLLIGKLLGASALGVYTLAFVLTDTFRSRLMSVINSVMYPLYGNRQTDFESLKRYYLKVVLFNCLFIFPIMLFFVMEGGPFITHVFGLKWQQTVGPLQILALSVMLHILVSGNTALLRGIGRPGLEMKQQLLKAAIFLPTLALGIYYYGLMGAAVAIMLNKFIVVVIAQYTFNFLIPVKISIAEFIAAIKAPLVASFFSASILILSRFLGLNFIIAGVILSITYCGIIWLMMGTELKALLSDFKK
ncbi:lipopolysaccharide biosynthesis protein [Mucilaginibacter phyllosphaerae]|uniref:Lipopolysaccharide biosynthesis protein n=1 Tax=Mucilaginibacter phyllosphaerae TaxID=1812349 RepID=A0A4Y8AB51_9SPHI|nr:lipopolysaccharide biosynthesis protein [Mucilaginibacter phyllosphaerae]MBB3969685.1 PST family polysaccharide transporter [Mucilaginibacter phyllosphaerae]TEW65069.1 lipopolysaccharide biosynthesis protein [Mucilaginibacter phyllosphaerae]GGH18183.1 lipopolysaccharide biosynthesis protein [Mucilaginibacter phyllosphaerae]